MPTVHDPDDDCCGPRAIPSVESLAYEELTPWWRDRTLLLLALSGVLLAASLMVGRFDAERVLSSFTGSGRSCPGLYVGCYVAAWASGS